MVRAAFIDKNGLVKGAWSEEEDNRLRAYVLRYGHRNWRLVPKYAGLNRCGKSCRLRWMNYLKPDVKRGNFTREEGELIKKLHDELGNKWSAIAARFPGRTDNEIKNYWHTHFNKRNRSNPKNSQVKSSQAAAHSMTSPENSYSDLKRENSESLDVFIFESSARSSISDLGSTVEMDWSSEMMCEPSDYLGGGSCWRGSEGGGSCSSDSYSGMFEESFVVDTSYIQEFGFPSFEDCGAYYNPVFGFDDDDEIKLF